MWETIIYSFSLLSLSLFSLKGSTYSSASHTKNCWRIVRNTGPRIQDQLSSACTFEGWSFKEYWKWNLLVNWPTWNTIYPVFFWWIGKAENSWELLWYRRHLGCNRDCLHWWTSVFIKEQDLNQRWFSSLSDLHEKHNALKSKPP